MLQQVSSCRGDKSRPLTANSLSQEYDLESLMSVAVCTNSPMKSLNRVDAIDQPDGDYGVISLAAKFVS